MHTLIPDVANPLTARMHKGINTTADEGQTAIVTHAVVAPLTAGSSKPGVSAPGRRQEDDENLVAFAQNQRDEVRLMDKAGALAAEPGMKQQTYVFEPRVARNDRGAPDAICPPLKAQSGKTGKGDAAPCVFGDMAVRRLTPLECERLQGFPDGYTDIPGASDSGRYKALGNSMAVPVMAWIGKRIQAVSDQAAIFAAYSGS